MVYVGQHGKFRDAFQPVTLRTHWSDMSKAKQNSMLHFWQFYSKMGITVNQINWNLLAVDFIGCCWRNSRLICIVLNLCPLFSFCFAHCRHLHFCLLDNKEWMMNFDLLCFRLHAPLVLHFDEPLIKKTFKIFKVWRKKRKWCFNIQGSRVLPQCHYWANGPHANYTLSLCIQIYTFIFKTAIGFYFEIK